MRTLGDDLIVAAPDLERRVRIYSLTPLAMTSQFTSEL